MPYEITASRKRPQTFEELAGQEFVSATLEASIASGRIAHAYLFSGPRGCGKTSTARILARALNCEKGPSAQPCGVCRSCQEIARGQSLDVIEIDGASNTSVDNVRQIKDEVLFPPNGGRYKVYIIDEVHMLSNSAFNALLKTIEEPPPYIVFIFATTELHKVPATIKSRCQQFAFRLFTVEVLKGLLEKAAAEIGVEAEEEALLWIAKEARGSCRDAYTLFDQVVAFSDGRMTAALIRDKLGLTGLDSLGALFRAGAQGDAKAALSTLSDILERGVSPEQLASEAAEYCRALLLIKSGIDKPSLLGAPVSAYDSAALEAFSADRLERALAGLLDLYRNLRFTVDPRFELELAVSKLCRLGDYVSPTELAGAVAALKRYVSGGAPAPAAPASGPARFPPGARIAASMEPGSAQATLGAAELGEKKKPEPSEAPKLPPQLNAAFASLASAARESERSQAEAPTPTVEPSAKPKAERRSPRVMRDVDPTPAPVAKEEPVAQPSSAVSEKAGPAPEPPAPADPDPAPGSGDVLRDAVIEALGKASPLLKTGLVNSLPWRLDSTRLVIPFRSGMEESVVRGSVVDIANKIGELMGRQYKVELRVEQPSRAAPSGGSVPGASGRQAAGPDPVEIVERVFRGARLPSGQRGDSDELR